MPKPESALSTNTPENPGSDAPIPQPENAPQADEAADDPKLEGNDSTRPSEAKGKPQGDGILRLGHVVPLNGVKLTRALASLTRRRGKRAAYAEATFEDRSKVLESLAQDPKAAIRLRSILGQGLQQGAKQADLGAFWCELLSVVDTFLHRVPFPETITSGVGRDSITPTSCRDIWHTIIVADDGKSPRGTKEVLAAQEVMLLDIIYAHWKGWLTPAEVLEAISHLELPEEVKDPHHRRLPWTPAASLATGLPAPIIVAQAAAVNGEIDLLERSRGEAERKAGQLEQNLSTTNEELTETQAALEEESRLLISAQQRIDQLEKDVQAAGAIHRHRADEIRSRYKGILEGDLDRHLRTIQRAAEMDPPRGAVIVERVETLLGTLKRELKWMEDLE